MPAAAYGQIYGFSADNLANKISAAYYVYPHLQYVFCFFEYFLASLAQYSISRLETTQVRSSRAAYETYESNDALPTMTPTLTPSQK